MTELDELIKRRDELLALQEMIQAKLKAQPHEGLSILLCKWPRFVFGFGDGCAREGAAPLPSPSDVEAGDS